MPAHSRPIVDSVASCRRLRAFVGSLLTLSMMFLIVMSLWARFAVACSTDYTIQEINLPDGFTYSAAADLNNLGTVVGILFEEAATTTTAFRWDSGVTQVLPNLTGYDQSIASGINNNGTIVGQIGSVSSQVFLGVRWTDLGVEPFPGGASASSAEPYAINDNGIIVGSVAVNDATLGPVVAAARWSSEPLELQILEFYRFGTTPFRQSNSAVGINASGMVVGSASWSSPRSGDEEATFWVGTSVNVLPTLNGRDQATAKAVNDAGWIVGTSSWSVFGSPVGGEATLWIDSVPSSLGSFPGYFTSSASSINSSGQIVGQALSADGYVAVAYCEGGPVDLNGLLAPGTPPGWTLYTADVINDVGQIVGSGFLNGNYRSYVATPVPEPRPISAIVAVLLAVAFCNR